MNGNAPLGANEDSRAPWNDRFGDWESSHSAKISISISDVRESQGEGYEEAMLVDLQDILDEWASYWEASLEDARISANVD